MKSEERHKLQQNELADILAQWLETIKPYKNAIYAGVIVVLVAVLLYAWRRHESANTLMAANDAFAQAMASENPDALLQVFEDHSDSKIASAAAIASADIRLRMGTQLLLQNKAVAKQHLQHAIDLYRKALDKKPMGLLLEQTYYGLGRAEESLGNLKEASGYYGKVIDENPEGAYAGLAQQRRQDLRRPSIREFYDRLAEYEPKSSILDQPNSSTPGSGLDLKDLPKEEPAIQLRDPLKLGPSTGEEKPAAGGEKKPEEAKSPILPGPQNPHPVTTGSEKKPEEAKSPALPGPETPAPSATGNAKKPEEAKTPATPGPQTPAPSTPPDTGKKPADNGEK
jgi:tetratricopeptide (TPR) repeat protein